MVSLPDLQTALSTDRSLECYCQANLNLYDSPALESLATQAVVGRQLRILPQWGDGNYPQGGAIQVQLCEDDYSGWLALEDLDLIEIAESTYQAITLSVVEIRTRLPQVVTYAHNAMTQPNHYLWGGTVGPNYDCSGLMQAAFAAAGIWLPRDSYQQEEFTQPISLESSEPGDLLFFGTPERANHVGLYLGDGYYIHSSGREKGRNGIGIDWLSETGDAISQAYYRLFRQAGRVIESYQPRQEMKA